MNKPNRIIMVRRRRNPVWQAAAFLGAGTIAAATIGWTLYSSRNWLGSTGPQSVSRSAVPPAAAANAVVALPAPDLLKPVTPEEAAKENAERPFVARPDSPASKFLLRDSPDDSARALTCLTQAVYYEAASEGTDGGRAVAQVVLNRMRHPGYPASVCGVVYQGSERVTGCQFTFTCDGSLLRVPAASLWARSRKIAQEALAGRVFAPVGHATHYHADYVVPYWADSLDKSVQIGRHIFYRLRGSYGDRASFFQRYAGHEPLLPEPRATNIVPPAAVTQELASALIDDGVANGAKDVEKAAPAASSPLLIDATPSTLIAGGEAGPPIVKRPKKSADCSGAGDRRLTPLGANDMRSNSTQSGC